MIVKKQITSSPISSLIGLWTISENNYDKIMSILSNKKIDTIVEFGSGISTLRLSKDFDAAKIISIEDDEKFRKKSQQLLNINNQKNAVVWHCPLKYVRFGLRSYLTYHLNVHHLPEHIDFVLIDGPTESVTLRGREAPLYLTFPFIRIGGIVALDDYHRKGAKTVVRNWLNSYRKTLKVLRRHESLILLEKIGDQSQPSYPGIYSMVDNFCTSFRLIFANLKRKVATRLNSL